MSDSAKMPVSFHEALLEQAFQNVRPMLLVNFATAVGASIALANDGITWSWAWLSLMVPLTVLRVITYIGYVRWKKGARPTLPLSTRTWTHIYAAGLWSAGALWSLAMCTWIASSKEHYGDPSKYTLLIIMAALAGGATGVAAPLKKAGMVYIATLLLPTSTLLAIFSPSDSILAVLGYVFCAVMLIGLNNNHKVILHSLRLESRNLELIGDLRELNASLEDKISIRTRELSQIAHTDALTGLANRHGLNAWWKRRQEKTPEAPVAVLFLDLDRFKQINDALGHDIGDQVLVVIANEIRAQVPEGGILARWGGDEFIVVTPILGKGTDYLAQLTDKIIDAVSLPFTLKGETVKLGVSIGWALYPDDERSFTDVVHAADLAVTEIKRTGRGCALPFSETYAESLRRRFDLSRTLSHAIGTDAITLAYQPIVDAKTGVVISREALARWKHPDLGSISPDEFIKLAEDTDRIVALGDWVLRQACLDARGWATKTNNPKVAVNVSMKQILAADFDLKLVKCLSETGLPPSQLEIEVTESLFDDSYSDKVLATIQNMRALGVSVHIDDFGTGYSSLSRLHQFPVTAIKIDKSFVSQMAEQDHVIIDSAIMIARRFGFKVIAEGVETAEQADLLRKLGVDLFQGYYYGRPECLQKPESQPENQPENQPTQPPLRAAG